MDIRINGQKADIIIDKEETIAEVMAAIETWISGSGHRLSGLSVDGKKIDSMALEEAFTKEIKSINTLDIYTNSIAELTVQSLLRLLDDLFEYQALDFEKRAAFGENWKKSAQAGFISQQAQDLFLLYADTFSGQGVNCDVLRSITEERLREVNTPAAEFIAILSLINENCSRLIDLSLDIQTGKDARSAQTIQIFSCLAEKIFRLYRQLDVQGYLPKADGSESPYEQLIVDFSAAVKELFDAYERQDSVLVGDLAEYEIAPRMKELYNAIEKSFENKAVNRV